MGDVAPPADSGIPPVGQAHNTFKGRCTRGLIRWSIHLSWLILTWRSSGCQSFSPYLRVSRAQPPGGGSSFRPLVSAILFIRSLPKARDYRWGWELCLPVQLPLNCSSSAAPICWSISCSITKEDPKILKLLRLGKQLHGSTMASYLVVLTLGRI